MSQFNLGYHAKEGFHNILSHGLMSFAAVCMIVACLLIMGSFSLVALNLDNVLGDLEDQNEFTAYVDESLTDGQVGTIESQISNLPNVASVTFVDREDALAQYVEQYTESDNQALFEDLPADVLRHRFRIHVEDLELMATTVNLVEGVEGISRIQAALDVTNGFVAVRNVATAVAMILVTMLMVISLFIIANTIRLATFHRRVEISIMRMCGATNWFIRWPFIFEGMILGLVGAVVAFGIQWGVYELVATTIVEYGGVQLFTPLAFESLWVRLLGIFSGSGILIGAGGSLMAIRRFLQV